MGRDRDRPRGILCDAAAPRARYHHASQSHAELISQHAGGVAMAGRRRDQATVRRRVAGERDIRLMRRALASAARVRLELAFRAAPKLSSAQIEAEADAAVKDLLALSATVSMEMTAQLFGAVVRSLLAQAMLSAADERARPSI